MTPSEMDKLDILAAEKVMGWIPDVTFDWVGWRNKDGIAINFTQEWSPTRNIADAFRLVDKLGGGMQLEGITPKSSGELPSCQCTFGLMAPVVAETAPLAITLAALRAVGVEDSNGE